jgi:ABC-type ATPase involved in cell division/GNAT superfamily N-acetyltransferase
MPRVDVVVETPPSKSARARQIEGLFDVPPRQKQTLRWEGDVPIDGDDWNVGLIVGPSGSGKSTVARALFGDLLDKRFEWPATEAIVDGFPTHRTMQEVSEICMAVGFNTIPAWLRPFHVLSNGEKFRVDLARRLAEDDPLIVVDEFTSVVDRQVAQIGSHAVQKFVRRAGRKFVAVSCHYDIIEWLNPDWVFEPIGMSFQRRSLRRRPSLELEVAKVDYATWQLFAPYHYMTADLNRSAACYTLFVGDYPAAFVGILHRPHAKVSNVWGVSRVVTLPDYQGLGLAFILMETLASAMRSLGQRLRTYPAHPALIKGFDKSPRWRLAKQPGTFAQRDFMGMGGRPNATFEYVGDAMPDANAARSLLDIKALQRH